MSAKFSDISQRQETDAKEFEIGTLAGYSERLAHIGGKFVARGRGRRRHWARRRAPLFDTGICGNGGGATPLAKGGCGVKKLGHMSNVAHSCCRGTGFFPPVAL